MFPVSVFSSEELKGACPLCWKNASLNTDALRIYPTTDEDGDRMAQQVKELECVTVDNQKLVVDMEQLRQQLEQERAAHERLRLQHAATALQLNNMREDDEIQSAIKKSFKSGLQKSERERKEALQKLAKMELKDLDSRKRIEQLEKEVEKYKREADRAKRNAIPRRYAVSSDSSDNEYSSQQNSLSYFTSQIP
ncbi:Paramyosin [Orchesella cincta]|uniref:Paramyosin n=1 Tax=Orchesella cincta TaxID=48709 RepID=A0A1D2M5V8_ORCCI|nr:Paramyosin [Orchesella cincta]